MKRNKLYQVPETTSSEKGTSSRELRNYGNRIRQDTHSSDEKKQAEEQQDGVE